VEREVSAYGQVFTPPAVVATMLALRRHSGPVLEPSCGDGAFLRCLPGATGVELDSRHCPPGALNTDFFAFPETQRFATVIGNPPYVRYQDILPATRALLRREHFDSRSNLYLFFIEKAVRHLAPGGELIFITPRDFLKATSAVRLNRWLHAHGTITDAIELGDARVFAGAVPNCLIWRFELGNFSRRTRYASLGQGAELAAALAAPAWEERHFLECAGHLLFARGDYPLRLADIASVKVGAVSGADDVFTDAVAGTQDFVCSTTRRHGGTRRMIWSPQTAPAALLPHKARLLARRIRRFDESNWWQWGRGWPQSDAPRVYLNQKTRERAPFFLHPCTAFDGAILAVFPHDPAVDLAALSAALNGVDWADLGFVCDGRFIFTQRSLENSPLPARFAAFLPAARAKKDRATPKGKRG